MKKEMNQSTLTKILSIGSICALVFTLALLIVYGSISRRLDRSEEHTSELQSQR